MASSARPILCAVLDVAALGGGRERCRDAALRLFDGGVDWIQLRDRRVEGLVLLEAAEGLVAARDAVPRDPESPCRVIVNRRADVALAAGADGVHLGFDALDPDSARLLLGAQAWLGVSLHAPGEVDSAARQRSASSPSTTWMVLPSARAAAMPGSSAASQTAPISCARGRPALASITARSPGGRLS